LLRSVIYHLDREILFGLSSGAHYQEEPVQTDAELIHAYSETGSEAAFTELVQRYVGLVYGTALRQFDGNVAAAKDATQEVFTLLPAGRLRSPLRSSSRDGSTSQPGLSSPMPVA